MDREVENPMVIDSIWDDLDEIEKENEWEKLCRLSDEQYDYDDGSVGYFDHGGVRSYRV